MKPRLEGETLPPLLPKLHRLLLHRIPYHRKMMTRSLILHVLLIPLSLQVKLMLGFICSTPVTFPFALIPIIPNFPLFYVLWRAWSHYKAWRGATYLESLLKLGIIVEKPSPELDEVYRSNGIIVGQKGSEDHAPDQTSSDGIKRGEASEKSRGGEQEQGELRNEEAREMPEQAQGKSSAPDGTTTPQSMIYPASSPTTAGAGAKTTAPRHPSMLLGLGQAPLLAKAFGLKPNEMMDVKRAIEQADGRAMAADKAKAQAGDGQKEASATEWRGNLHR